jgi:hypothetical protein
MVVQGNAYRKDNRYLLDALNHFGVVGQDELPAKAAPANIAKPIL